MAGGSHIDQRLPGEALHASPSLSDLPQLQMLQGADFDAELIHYATGGKGRDDFGESESEEVLQLDDVLEVLDSWDECVPRGPQGGWTADAQLERALCLQPF